MTISRTPEIKLVETPAFGKRLDVLVDLGDGEPIGPEGLDIDVVMMCWGFEIPENQRRKTLRLNPDGTCVPVLFSGQISLAQDVRIMAHFSHAGRHSGYAERTIPLSDILPKTPIKEI